MLEAASRSGVAEHPAVFEVFARSLPQGRRYGVVAGVARLVEAIETFRFGEAELEALAERRIVGNETLERLSDYRFTGTIDAYAEGELYFPGSPVLTVTATFGEAVLLETLVLSVLNHDSAVASAAARMVVAAAGRPIIEMGGRRTHEQAAVAAARAAYLAGFASTSNLEAGRRYRIPTAGTAAHAFVLAHPDERSAFSAQVAAQGPGTTLLVDTYDTAQGIRTAVEVAGPELGAIRVDSGKLPDEARRARALLDELGATSTRIVVSGDLDEFSIAELKDAPVDAFGVGTRLVTGSGAPTAGFVYKLVAIAERPDGPLRPVAKRSFEKAGIGGRKRACRLLGRTGRALGELVVLEQVSGDDPEATAAARAEVEPGGAGPVPVEVEVARPLQVRVVEHGRPAEIASLDEARAHHRRALAELPEEALQLEEGPPALPTLFLPAETAARRFGPRCGMLGP
jgi:nicotinate phosphoribosyltransferase